MPKRTLKISSKALPKQPPEVQTLFKTWKTDINKYKYLILMSIIVLLMAEVACFYASTYVDTVPAVPSHDLILDNIPTLNLGLIYVYGFILSNILIALYAIIYRVKEFHKIAFIFCVLIITRSFFMILTHLGVPADASIITHAPSFFKSLNFQNDLFFSGHTAVTFMAFLMFRKDIIGKFFLIMTAILSATVLLMHVHYSIDVFSAFFITYGVYKFCGWVIDKGYLDFRQASKQTSNA